MLYVHNNSGKFFGIISQNLTHARILRNGKNDDLHVIFDYFSGLSESFSRFANNSFLRKKTKAVPPAAESSLFVMFFSPGEHPRSMPKVTVTRQAEGKRPVAPK